MKTYRTFWQLVAFAPWWHLLNVCLQLLRSGFLLLPGLIVSAIFALLNANRPIGWDLWTLGALFVGVAVVRTMIVLGSEAADAICMGYGSALIRQNILARLMGKPGAQALSWPRGELINRFDADVAMVTETLGEINVVLGTALLTLVALLIMITINWQITLLILIPLLGSGILMNRLSARIQTYYREGRRASGAASAFLGEMFHAVQALQLANAHQRVIDRLQQLNEARRHTTLRSLLFTDVVLDSLARNTTSIATGAILLLAVQAMKANTFSVSSLALFVAYIDEIAGFTALFSQTIVLYKQAAVSFQRLEAIMPDGLARTGVVAHSPVHLRGVYPRLTVPERQAPPLEHLEVRDMTYRYPQSGRGIAHITFQVRRGNCTVITGRIGAGKTTLLRTLLGLLPRQTGELFWNGEHIAHPERFFVPPQSAYTPQVPHLWSETLKENLLMGYPDEPGGLALALYTAVMEADVQMFENGLETQIGSKGTRLSGGQVQRTAAARMFLREPDLLICDDLSSALDIETERLLWDRLFIKQKRTCLLVSHRRFAFQHADHIIVLKDGQLVGEGTLADLLVSNHEMRQLWEGQRNDVDALDL